MVDFHGKGADFKRDFMGDVQDVVARMLSNINATFAAQKDGVVQSDQHRVLNFTGAGVTVIDDAPSRRAIINIPGGVAFSRRTVIVSTAGQGSVLVSAVTPANDGTGKTWRQTGYALTGWSSVIACTADQSIYLAQNAASIPPGASSVGPQDGNVSAQQIFYFHYEFTLTAADLSSPIFDFKLDQGGEAYLNDTLIGTDTDYGPGSYQSDAIAPGILIAGTNTLAIRVLNSPASGVAPGPAGSANPSSIIGYRLTVAITGSPTTSNYLTADVNLTTNNTFFNGPSISLTSGTWLLLASACFQIAQVTTITMRIWDGTTEFSSGEIVMRTATDVGDIGLSAIVTVSATTTIYVAATSGSDTGAKMKAAPPQNSGGNHASFINAVRLA